MFPNIDTLYVVIYTQFYIFFLCLCMYSVMFPKGIHIHFIIFSLEQKIVIVTKINILVWQPLNHQNVNLIPFYKDTRRCVIWIWRAALILQLVCFALYLVLKMVLLQHELFIHQYKSWSKNKLSSNIYHAVK